MLAEFSVIPLGKGSGGTGVGDVVAEVVGIVHESGLAYKLNPMGTVVEGGWDEVTALIKRCHQSAMNYTGRVVTSINIDDREGRTGMIDSKVRSVQERLGKKINK